MQLTVVQKIINHKRQNHVYKGPGVGLQLCSGTADHRDMVLEEEEKSGQIIVCVFRAISEELVLDL